MFCFVDIMKGMSGVKVADMYVLNKLVYLSNVSPVPDETSCPDWSLPHLGIGRFPCLCLR
jgi:hypothetical protein